MKNLCVWSDLCLIILSSGCDMCADNRNGECPMHGPLHSLRRLVGTSSTAAPVTLPDVPDWLRDLPREVRLLLIWLPGYLTYEKVSLCDVHCYINVLSHHSSLYTYSLIAPHSLSWEMYNICTKLRQGLKNPDLGVLNSCSVCRCK